MDDINTLGLKKLSFAKGKDLVEFINRIAVFEENEIDLNFWNKWKKTLSLLMESHFNRILNEEKSSLKKKEKKSTFRLQFNWDKIIELLNSLTNILKNQALDPSIYSN